MRRVTIDRREQTVRIDGLPAAPHDGGVRRRQRDGQDARRSTSRPPGSRRCSSAQRASLEPRLGHRAARARARPTRPRRAALARAARGADYSAHPCAGRRRARRLSRGVALPALEAAARDTSALGPEGGGRGARRASAAPARWLWRGARGRGDPSYQVRAAALTALGRLDPTRARARRCCKGSSTPSYRDVDSERGRGGGGSASRLRAGRGRGARSRRAAAAGDRARRAHGARRPAARRALAAALDDGRGWVREWALDGVEEQLDRADALRVLRAALPEVRKNEARADVEAALRTLE